MKKNMGSLDRALRLLFAVAVVLLYLSETITGTAAIVLGVFAGIFLVTSAIGFCPLYAPFHFSTCPKETPPSASAGSAGV